MKAQLRINGATHQQLATLAANSGLTFTAKPVTVGDQFYETIVGVNVYERDKKVGCFRHMGQGKGITLEVDSLALSPHVLANLIAAARALA